MRTTWEWVGLSCPAMRWAWLMADRRRVIVAALRPAKARSATRASRSTLHFSPRTPKPFVAALRTWPPR